MENVFSRKEAAAYMGISVATLDRIVHSGQIAYIQRIPGGKVQITMDAINEYVSRITKPAAPALVVRNTYRKRRKTAQ